MTTLSDAIQIVTEERALGHHVVFTNGCFDILHVGHVSYLQSARDKGDFLVVGLNSDVSVRQLKGSSRPVNGEMDRFQVLCALRMVDLVVIFDDGTPIRLIEALQPDIHVKGGDYLAESLPEYGTVMSYGGSVEIVPLVPGRSTSRLIDVIRDL